MSGAVRRFDVLKGMTPGTRGGFAKRAAVASLGAAGGQVAVVVASPFLARWYSPSDFGYLGSFLGVMSLLAIVSTLQLEMAIPIPADDAEANGLVRLAFQLSFAIGLTGAAIALLLGLDPVHVGVAVVTVLGMSIFSTLALWCIRTDRFLVTAAGRLWLGVATVGFQIVAALMGAGVVGLVAGPAFGWASAAIVLAYRGGVDWGTMPLHRRRLLLRHRRFPMFTMAGAVMNRGAQEAATIGLLVVFGPKSAGLFYLCSRSITVPANVIASGASQSFVHQAAPLARDDLMGLRRLVRKTSLTFAALAVLPVIGAMLVVPSMLPRIFGEDWSETGRLAVVILPSVVALMACVPVASTLLLLERNDLDMFRDAARLALVVGVFVLAAQADLSLFATVSVLSGVMSVMYVVKVAMIFRAIDQANVGSSHMHDAEHGNHQEASSANEEVMR